MRKISSVACMLVVFALGTAARADTTVGTNEPPGEENCLPFGCDIQVTGNGPTTQYQQVYSSAAFGSPESISGLTFYYGSGSTDILSGTYDIYLSTTAAAVDGLSTDPAANRGSDFTLVDVFNGGVNSDPSFTIEFAQPFSYDPGNGNLLLEVDAFGQPNNTPNPVISLDSNFLESDLTGQVTSRAWGPFSNGPLLTDSIGLVTTFDTSPVPTPEPGALAMIALGLGMLFFLRKKRLKRTT